jgi:hypothetical protein
VTELTRPELRISDAERRACDEQLKAAVGAGLLTLPEYEERVGGVWSARTAGDLAVLVQDLPSPSPAQAAPARRPSLRRRHRRLLLVVAAVIGIAAVNSAEHQARSGAHANIGNRTIFAVATDNRITIPAGVGNVIVVIPDSTHADTEHITGVIGNVVCDDACTRQTDHAIDIVSAGNRTGNIVIETRQEYALK